MTDVLSPEQRRACMAAVKGKNTSPELLIRSLVHKLGYRYTLHDPRLPGKPDLVFPWRKKIIFVHGCFWHMHSCRQGKNAPATNVEYWERKRTRNRDRDRKHIKALTRAGWGVMTIWECRLKNELGLRKQLLRFLTP